jgi:hypothetical protein
MDVRSWDAISHLRKRLMELRHPFRNQSTRSPPEHSELREQDDDSWTSS